MVKARSALVMGSICLLAAPAAWAHQSPPGCSSSAFTPAPTVQPSTAHNGETVTYRVNVANSGLGACDITVASGRLTLPAVDGTPNGQTVTFMSGASVPAGTPPTLVATVPYLVAVSPGLNVAVAGVRFEGVVHDAPTDHAFIDSRQVPLEVAGPASSTAATGGVGGTVPATLALTLGAPAAFGSFVPGLAKEYTAFTTATVISSAADATLSVADPAPNAPGHLVNGAFSLASPLQGLGVLKTYTAPAANDVVTVTFRQSIGATDPLRTGTYSKTLTFTLSTSAP